MSERGVEMGQLSGNRQSFGKAMSFAFKPGFGRSLRPYARSRGNIASMVTHLFVSLGLIDRTHPFARSTTSNRNRLRDVLGLAWGKLDWRNPLKTENVTVLAVTLILACAGLALLGFIGTMTFGLGRANAQLFTPPNPTTDLAMGYLSQAFGVETAGHASPPVDLLVGAFQNMMAMYSTAMLILGGFILLYIGLTVVAGTAHEGRFGGSGFNQIWAPLRLVVAVGLLIPVGAGGYNSGQYAVVKVAEWGSGLASNLWDGLGTRLGSGRKVLSTALVPPLADTVWGTFKNELCMTVANLDNDLAAEGGLPVSKVTDKISALDSVLGWANVNADITITYSDHDGKPICGSILIPQAPTTSGAGLIIGKQVATIHRNEFNTMRSALRAGVIDPIVANRQRYLPAGGVAMPQNIAKDFASPLNTIIKNYQSGVNGGILGLSSIENDAAANAMTSAIREAGWVGAASWFNTIARLNAEYHDRMGSVPQAKAPNMKSDGSGDPSLAGFRAYKVANDVASAFVSYTTTAGVNTQGSSGTRPTAATTAGIVNDPLDVAGQNFTARLNSELKDALSPFLYLSPFNADLGPDTVLKTTNPLAELSKVGNYLLYAAGGLAGVATLAFAISNSVGGLIGAGGGQVIGFTLMALASIAFSAGITLFYILPLLPFIRMMFGVMGWILNVLECIIAIPLFALAHLSKNGEGFMTGMASTGYQLIFSVFMKPALLIVGLGISTAMFIVGMTLLNGLWSSAVVGWRGAGVGTISFFGQLMYTVIYTAIAYSMANMCYKLIEEVPDRVLSWFGRTFPSVTADESAVKTAAGSFGDKAFVGVSNFRGLPPRSPKEPPSFSQGGYGKQTTKMGNNTISGGLSGPTPSQYMTPTSSSSNPSPSSKSGKDFSAPDFYANKSAGPSGTNSSPSGSQTSANKPAGNYSNTMGTGVPSNTQSTAPSTGAFSSSKNAGAPDAYANKDGAAPAKSTLSATEQAQIPAVNRKKPIDQDPDKA